MNYFAYASNLSRKQMRERCPDCKPVITATLPNYKLVFTGWSRVWRGGVATIQVCRGEKVRGAIYEVTEACMRQLDKHEAGYNRLEITVFDENNEPLSALTYIKTGKVEESAPSQQYLSIIRQGYQDWDIT